ncbi:GxxExxY protein [candidate division KSB1 bacterium]|nr:GxxExxY protein [candidate division KSB1 bacterium]MBL7094388.1 GxxExxY protein [candidate division KSB1 bacterium]
MPIGTRFQVKEISDKEFKSLDYKIMGIVFDVHNEFGPLCSEKIYKTEIADRCLKQKLGVVQIEEPIYVSYMDFTKTYFMDLLIDNSVMYEMKATRAIISEHRKQAINYLLLANMNSGKLVNMRTSSVQSEYVSTNLNKKKRYHYIIYDQGWINIDYDSIWIKKMIIQLISDWGVFLDTNLFYEAIIYYRGGKENVIKKIEIKNDSRILGEQKIHLLNHKTAFKISAAKKHITEYEKHLGKFFKHTSLMAIQWINFNNHNVTFKTIINE